VWWHICLNPILGRLKQKDHEVEASLSYIVKPCPKIKKDICVLFFASSYESIIIFKYKLKSIELNIFLKTLETWLKW
jgi:hypothetical protein